MRRPMTIALALLLLAATLVSLAPIRGLAQAQRWIFEGRVFDGPPGDTSQPLSGVSVALYVANNPCPDPGKMADSTTTDAEGFFRLIGPPGAEFYSIRETDPPGYESTGAETEHGEVCDANWIQYVLPLEEKNLSANWFFDRRTMVVVTPSVRVVTPPVRLVTPLPLQQPDLAIGNFFAEPIAAGDSHVVLVVEVVNQGPGEVDETVLYVEDADGGLPGREAIVPQLGPGQAVPIRVELPIPDEQRGTTHSFLARIDATERMAESNEKNNVARSGRVHIPAAEVVPEQPEEGEVERPPPSIPWPLIAVVVIGGFLGLFLASRFFRQEFERGRQPSMPGLLPVRLMNIWLTEGSTGRGRVLKDSEHLTAGASYSLHVQVQPRGAQKPSRQDMLDVTKLDVVLFSPDSDFPLERKTATLQLPRRGASNEVHLPIQPRQAGRRRLRVCIYYRNVLLQSALLEASVIQRGVRAPALPRGRLAIARMIDYVASADLILVKELPRPALNIFTNQTSDGSRWIGVYASGQTGFVQLGQGVLRTFGPRVLETMAEKARTCLAQVHGERGYTFDPAIALDAQGQMDRLERHLLTLARNGRELYHGLFGRRTAVQDGIAELQAMQNALQPCIVSIAACESDGANIPWATLYGLDLEPNAEIHLCPLFKDMLLHGRDLLSDAQSCRNQARCPQRGGDAYLTVCPFGLWGFLHQVEQPLQLVEPTPVDEVPRAALDPRHQQTSFVERAQPSDVKVAVAAYPGLPNAREHERELEALVKGRQMDFVCEEERKGVMQLLTEGSRHLYYFYCHGEVQGYVFRLKLGPADHPGYIGAADLDWRRMRWSSQLRPLMILNACETVALMPERIDDLIYTLKDLGACGVVGTEIRISTLLGRPFGYQLLTHILAGQSVGEAFLSVRQELLRQYNPLGLVYTYYSPATLHLHDRVGCQWCQTHRV